MLCGKKCHICLWNVVQCDVEIFNYNHSKSLSWRMNPNPSGCEWTVQTIENEYSYVFRSYTTQKPGQDQRRCPQKQKHQFWPSQGPTVTKVFVLLSMKLCCCLDCGPNSLHAHKQLGLCVDSHGHLEHPGHWEAVLPHESQTTAALRANTEVLHCHHTATAGAVPSFSQTVKHDWAGRL